MEQYYDLGEDTIKTINDLISKFVAHPVRLEYEFVGDNKLKKLIKVEKIADKYAFRLKKQILVSVNESLWDSLSHEENIIEILVREELNTIHVNGQTGKIKIQKLSFTSSESILDKYTYEEVKRVKNIEKLALQQAEDKENDLVDISA